MSERLARFTWIAARLDEETAEDDIPAWSREELGVAVPVKAARDAVRPMRPASPRTGRPSKGPPRPLARTPVIWDWLRVDAQAVGLTEVLFELPNPSWTPRPELVPSLAQMRGITQVLETKAGGDVFAVGLVHDEHEADDLESRVQDLVPGQGVRMRRIAQRTDEPARATWRSIAKREAEEAER